MCVCVCVRVCMCVHVCVHVYVCVCVTTLKAENGNLVACIFGRHIYSLCKYYNTIPTNVWVSIALPSPPMCGRKSGFP